MLNHFYKKIIIWKRQDCTYYYRIVRGMYCDYHIGYINRYGHEIVLIIENLEYNVKKTPYKTRLKRKLINYLEKW